MKPDWPHHCAAWAADKAGLDVWDRFGGCPRNWREAARLYRKLGVRNLGDAVSMVLPEIEPLKAMRGDIVMADGALGICRGEWAEFMDSIQPMKRVTRAWRAHG